MIALIAYSLLIAGSASGLALLVSGFIVIHGAVLWPMWISFPLCTLLGVLLSGSDVGRTGALHLVGTFLGLVGIAGLFGGIAGSLGLVDVVSAPTLFVLGLVGLPGGLVASTAAGRLGSFGARVGG